MTNTVKNLIYFFKRLLPFVLFQFLAEFLTSGYLFATTYTKVDLSFWPLFLMILVFIGTTIASTLFLLIPYVLYLIFIPSKKLGTRLDKWISLIFFFLFSFGVLFEEMAEYFFWEEFELAFNFIAVDYLVYTNEVIGNIYQSYPVVPLLTIMFLITLLFTYLFRRMIALKPEQPVKIKHRFVKAFVYAVFVCCAYGAVEMSDTDVTNNRYNNELSKEGGFAFINAFLHNELDYQQFYVTQSDEENLRILRESLTQQGASFVDEKTVARQIVSEEPEIRANVMIVLMESMGSEFLKGFEKEDRALTPNLNRLMEEGIYFKNVYATGTRSVRGIEALTIAVPPLPGMAIVRRANNDKLYTIGSIFRKRGYQTKWIYGGHGYFDNMNAYMSGNGFEIIDRNDFEKNEIEFSNIWGVCDEDLYKKAIQEADKSYGQGKRFLNIVFTTSNHRPFTYPEGRIDLPPKVSKRDGGVKYADYAVGQLLKQAAEKPWFDDTIFLFVADHGAGSAGKEELNVENHHIPAFIYAPKIFQPAQHHMVMSQMDILPTLLGLMHFNYESRFFGQDVLKPDYVSRYFVSNYQRIGFIRDGKEVVLKPVKQISVDGHEPTSADEPNIKEAIAYYQYATDWEQFLKE